MVQLLNYALFSRIFDGVCFSKIRRKHWASTEKAWPNRGFS